MLMRIFILKWGVCTALLAAALPGQAQSIAQTLFYDGVYYETTDEMRVKIVASTGDPYAGDLSIPNFFNVTNVDSEGKPVISSYFVTEVADGAFEGCDALRKITFNGTTIKFGKNAFKGCTSLRAFVFPTSFAADTEVGESAFEGCTSLGEISFGNRVAPVGARAFAGCTDLTDITVGATTPPGLGAGAFDDATLAQATVYVPKSSVTVYKADDGWKGFKAITAISEYSFVKDGVYYLVDDMNPKKAKVTLDGYGSYSGDVVIPEYVTNNGVTYTVQEIGRDAFRGSTGLTSVSLPESVYNLGINAFQGCTGLRSITLPDAVGSLPDELFRDCTSLERFVCPEGLGVIRQSVFRGCTALEEVTLAPEVYLIGAYAFADCVNLKKFQASEKMNLLGDFAFANCTSLSEVIGVPEWTYWYAKSSFAGCDNIRYIHVPVAEPPRCPNENMFTETVYRQATLVVPQGSVEAYRTSVHGDNDTPDVWQKFETIVGSETSIGAVGADDADTCPRVYYNLQGFRVAAPEKGMLYIRVCGDKADKVIL